MRNKRGLMCMAAGLLLLAMSLSLTGYNIWDENRANASAEKNYQLLRAQMSGIVSSGPEKGLPDYILAGYQADPRVEMPEIEIDGHSYIGYVSIPALELELPVMSQWSYPNMKIAPCRYTGSVYLDDLVIAAHNYEKHFGQLRYLSEGALVRFTDVEGNEFDYTVSSLEQLRPNQTADMVRDSGEWDLTLFTCTVGGQLRLTVRCVRTELPEDI